MKEESYYDIIDRCAKDKEDFPIQNSDLKHASYLLKTLFRHAESDVCIFTGKLFPGVFDDKDLRNEAIEFLRKGSDKKLKIVYQEAVRKEEITSGLFLSALMADEGRKGTVEVWDVKADILFDIHHFAVMDRSAFRFELDQETRKAIANFGDKKGAENLADIFEKIVLKSEKVLSAAN